MAHQFKIMIIDDSREERETIYKQTLSHSDINPIFVWSRELFDRHQKDETPVDGYLIDVFLDNGDWDGTDAAEVIRNYIQNAPRPAPIFLVSKRWDDPKILSILKQTGESSAKVVQYLAWNEFIEASFENDQSKKRKASLLNKLLFELKRWHGQSGFKPGPDDSVKILLLADLQYGDPKEDPQAKFVEHIIADTLKKDKFLPDLLVIAGDVAFSGSPVEYHLAQERLSLDLMGLLWGENNIDNFRDRIILVPGNHDVNLRFSACDNYNYDLDEKILQIKPEMIKKDDRKKNSIIYHHRYALDPFRRFAYQLTGDRNWNDSVNLSWVDRRFLHCGLRFFILNSVVDLDSNTPQKSCFDADVMRQIGRSLGNEDNGSIFTIALSHHGLRPEGGDQKETEIEDWLTVGRDNFSIHNVRLWLFGHYHEYYSRSLNGKPFDKNPLWLVQTPTLRMGPASRGFCMLKINRKDGIVKNITLYPYQLGQSIAEQKESRKIFDKG